MKRLYSVLVIGIIGAAVLAIFFAFSFVTGLDSSECRRAAAEQNRWEFCGTVLAPVMTMVVLRENNTSVFDSEVRYDDRFGVDCADIPDCDVLTYSRVVQPAEPLSISRNSDVIFIAEGKYTPANMTIKIQGFLPSAGNSSDANGRVLSIENITDTGLTLKEHKLASNIAPNEPQTSPSFRYSINNLPNGYFILNIISKWDVDTLQQDHETTTLHRFKINVVS